jgi:hypothetical protein
VLITLSPGSVQNVDFTLVSEGGNIKRVNDDCTARSENWVFCPVKVAAELLWKRHNDSFEKGMTT